MRGKMRTASIVVALGGLTLAPPSAAEKIRDQARFKVLSMSGTLTHTFQEDGWREVEQYDDEGNPLPPTRDYECIGSQSERVQYRSTEPFKAYVSLKTIPHRGLSTIVSSTADPENFDRVSVQGEMTLSKSVSYERTEGCRPPPPPECPVSTFSSPVIAFGTNLSNGGLTTLWDPERLDLPPGLDRSCEPQLGAEHGPLSPGAVPPEESVIPGAISRADLFGKRKRLSGEDSREFAYETRTRPEDSPGHVTVTGTYGETVAVELKRLKSKKK